MRQVAGAFAEFEKGAPGHQTTQRSTAQAQGDRQEGRRPESHAELWPEVDGRKLFAGTLEASVPAELIAIWTAFLATAWSVASTAGGSVEGATTGPSALRKISDAAAGRMLDL
jgi:hypothetical protein